MYENLIDVLMDYVEVDNVVNDIINQIKENQSINGVKIG